jgi:hypothetical protein
MFGDTPNPLTVKELIRLIGSLRRSTGTSTSRSTT